MFAEPEKNLTSSFRKYDSNPPGGFYPENM
jgi:hypothetical protein